MRKCICALAALFMLGACAAPSVQESRFTPGGHQEGDTLRRKIAQMLLIGFRGTELAAGSPLYHSISELGIGGVILFDLDLPSRSRPRNIVSKEQLSRLVSDLQSASAVPLFIAIDQEGGRVNRLRTQEGFPPTLSAREMAGGGQAVTRSQAAQTAALLAATGINLNFAPCVDLDINPDNPIIGAFGRSFSAEPQTVVEHAAIWIEEHRRRRIISTIKHFPGHGSSLGDTHHQWVDVSAQWQEQELEPFRSLIAAQQSLGPLMVMTSHVFNKHLDPVYPATLSHAIITGILRDTLHFDGVVVSDDMEMDAIQSYFGFEQSLERAIYAGVDVLVLANNAHTYDPYLAQRALDTIYALVRSGAISEARIKESWNRIMALKRSML